MNCFAKLDPKAILSLQLCHFEPSASTASDDLSHEHEVSWLLEQPLVISWVTPAENTALTKAASRESEREILIL